MAVLPFSWFDRPAAGDGSTGVYWKIDTTIADYTGRDMKMMDTRILALPQNSTLPTEILQQNRDTWLGGLRMADGFFQMRLSFNRSSRSGDPELNNDIERNLIIAIRVTTQDNRRYGLAVMLTDRNNPYDNLNIVEQFGWSVGLANPNTGQIISTFLSQSRGIATGDRLEVVLVKGDAPHIDREAFSFFEPVVVEGDSEATPLRAVLLEAGSTVRVTNYDRNIFFDGKTYLADRTLTEVEGPLRGGDFPRYSFDLDCPEGSPQRTLFAPGSGPEPAAITNVRALLSQQGIIWQKEWSFEGVLGEGAMVEGSYSGLIQHPFEWRLHALPRRYWTARAIRAANPDDAGGDWVATIGRNRLSAWRGTRMEPAK